MVLYRDDLQLKRLSKLWSMGLIETESEERFDLITRTAKRLFDMPFAMIGLIDDQRQWFKSIDGMDTVQVPRQQVFCDVTMNRDHGFVIEDTLVDENYRQYAMVQGDPGVRFYAGYPLSVDGEKLGTICVLDTRPRQFGAEDLNALKDLAELVEEQIRLSSLAMVDELTGLLNRRGFTTSSEHALAFCRRHCLEATLLYVDLDDFKQINDNHGHAEGDLTLKSVAQALRSNFRDSDLVARIGGDEFALLLPATRADQAVLIVDRLKQQLAQHHLSSGQLNPLTFSSGSSEVTQDSAKGILEHLQNADERMYALKSVKS